MGGLEILDWRFWILTSDSLDFEILAQGHGLKSFAVVEGGKGEFKSGAMGAIEV